MVIVAEIKHKNNAHTEFNSAFLYIIHKIFPDEKIIFMSDDEHSRVIRKKLKKCNILYENISVDSIISSKKHLLKKEVSDIWNLMKIIFNANKNNFHKVFFTCLSPVSLSFLKIICFLYKKINFYAVLHSEIETIKKDSGAKFYNLNYWSKLSLRIPIFKNLKLIVLGESIFVNLQKNLNIKRNNYIIIDHPYFFHSETKNKEENDSIIRFGSVGTAALSKNSHYIFKIAKKSISFIDNGELTFEHIGLMGEDVLKEKNELVKYTLSGDLLDRDVFEKKVRNLDYILYFYDESMYKLTASGVLFDAINFGKPIISLNNDFFSYYFNKLGDVGYLCDNLDDMALIINQIVKYKDLKRYRIQINNLKKAKNILSLNDIGAEFLKQLS